jgi:probable phosphoglycerate mutase
MIFLLRHGQSEANVRGLIASSPAAAGGAFGLTAVGQEQVRQSVIAARDAAVLPRGCRVVSSPLLRARESAAIAARVLEGSMSVDPRLAERGFGQFELSSDEHYEQVWSEDRADPSHEKWGVESAAAIFRRAGMVVRELQRMDSAGSFVLCTHGDVASILLCAARGLPLSRHREVGALRNGEVRALQGYPDTGEGGIVYPS